MKAPGKERGFTLVELGVVVAIITVIFAVTGSRLVSATDDARMERILNEFIVLENAAAQVWVRDNTPPPYPTFIMNNVDLSTWPGAPQSPLPAAFTGLNPWNQPYTVSITNNGNNGTLTATTCVPVNITRLGVRDNRIVNTAACALTQQWHGTNAGQRVTFTAILMPTGNATTMILEKSLLYGQ